METTCASAADVDPGEFARRVTACDGTSDVIARIALRNLVAF
jgi:hypothetical protein